MPEKSTSYVTFEPPYLVHWHLIGRVEEQQVLDMYRKQVELTRNYSQYFMFTHVSRLESFAPAARRAIADNPYSGVLIRAVRGSAIIGASFHFQVLGMLLFRAAKAIHKKLDLDMQFFATEALARAWFEKRVRDLEAKPSK